MKRISISTIVLLVIAAGAAQARHVYSTGYGFGFGYGSNSTRTRWSMYAHGLISGDVYYSPYVFGSSGSRLVDGHVRYSPYAFGGGRSGLISDDGATYSSYGYVPVYYYVTQYPFSIGRDHIVPDAYCSNAATNQQRAPRKYRETAEDRRARRAALAKAREQRDAIKANDGKEIIAGYLKSNNIPFRMTRMLNIAGKVVSIDFLLNDGKTILKYWNPAEIPSEGKLQERQRKFFEKYLQSWKVACAEHLQAGGNVHQIISSDRNDILAKLPQCPDLNGIEKVYASAQSETASAETP